MKLPLYAEEIAGTSSFDRTRIEREWIICMQACGNEPTDIQWRRWLADVAREEQSKG